MCDLKMCNRPSVFGTTWVKYSARQSRYSTVAGGRVGDGGNLGERFCIHWYLVRVIVHIVNEDDNLDVAIDVAVCSPKRVLEAIRLEFIPKVGHSSRVDATAMNLRMTLSRGLLYCIRTICACIPCMYIIYV